jgi:hypothetical protein
VRRFVYVSLLRDRSSVYTRNYIEGPERSLETLKLLYILFID